MILNKRVWESEFWGSLEDLQNLHGSVDSISRAVDPNDDAAYNAAWDQYGRDLERVGVRRMIALGIGRLAKFC